MLVESDLKRFDVQYSEDVRGLDNTRTVEQTPTNAFRRYSKRTMLSALRNMTHTTVALQFTLEGRTCEDFPVRWRRLIALLTLVAI